MGGLIAKRMLVTLNKPEFIHRLAKIRSVLFLATPAQGSRLGKIANWFSGNPQFANLAPSDLNAYLHTLEDDWQSLLRGRVRAGREWPKAFCAYETKPLTTWSLVVVSRIDAVSQCDDNRLAIDTDHINIVKPSSPDEQPYPWAKARILQSAGLKGPDWQKVVLMDSSLPDVVYDPDTKRAGGTNADDLAQVLQPVNVRTIKELVHPLWNREEQIKGFEPALIIVHFSSFYGYTNPADTDHRFQTFVDALIGTGIKLLVYTRKPEYGDEQLKGEKDLPPEELQELQSRLNEQIKFLAARENLEVKCYLLEGTDGAKTFRNPNHARKIREFTRQMLNLGGTEMLRSCRDYIQRSK
jgi:hypothetical protein